MPRARVLCVDNYDSFVYTIVGYLRRLGADVEVRRNDDVPLAKITSCEVDGVLISPGPSAPAQAGDSLRAIEACASAGVPMLGVCLGHQALGEWAGASVVRAPELMHGKTSMITHTGTGVFTDLPSPLRVTRYHSLALDPDTIPDTLEVTATTESGIIMGVRHREVSAEGVQFHPEALLTEHGYPMFARWLDRLGMTGVCERARDFSPGGVPAATR
ncbi:gamma-glutamyl-gamma-aminobutyrate hydrolase family protein [Nanchangia anserum]|uniref:Gamma-glutamyl-gamma-aminobutyrate hydrolase family protein n=2 Tax=Nanchangia anserum TaxID=2692125 RepID=A0A8I0GC86_9ACTO|nr:gamma-glutamyl-gamma-aminobutyrate hydrolase family protein [Nanchangia anserum]QOX82659.1 gamma-glutamyl-gamma-aminobutyrate hydrolase family protein [Nanchangia anserum]